MREQILNEENLHTVLSEVGEIINSQPTAKASSDPNDLEALMPNAVIYLLLKVTICKIIQ